MADEFMVAFWGNVGFDGLGELAFTHTLQQLPPNVNPDIICCLFPNRPRDLIIYSHQMADAISQEAIEQKPEIKGVRAIIHYAIMARLHFLLPYRLAVKAMVYQMAQPQNLPLAGKLMAQSADIIWRLAGDKSHDLHYYTKRTLLIGVMNSTIPVYLNDTSENLADTAQFLANRLDNVVDIGKFLHKNLGDMNFVERFLGQIAQKSNFFMRSPL